jgi:hypothetical protein
MRTTAFRRCGSVFAAVAVGLAAPGRAAESLQWNDVAADAPVDHAVTIRGPFHDAHEQVALAGPVALVAARDEADSGPCFTAYAVVADGDEPERCVEVGEGEVALRLGPVAFLLVPAKRLADGAPADAPRGVYEVRPILDPPAAIPEEPADAGPPTHLCLPVDYRHHFDRLPVEDAGRGLVIFASRPDASPAAAVRVVDDFGLNRLVPGGTSRAAAWTSLREAVRR